VTAESGATVNYSGAEGLIVEGGNGGSDIFVSSTQAATTVDAYGYAGVLDVIAVGFGSDVNQILGPVHVYGQGADGDFAYYYEYLNPSARTYTVTADHLHGTMLIDRPGIAGVQYAGVWGVSFYAPVVGGSSLNVRGTPAGMQLGVAAGAGDVLTVGSKAPIPGSTVDDIRGHLFVGADDATFIVDDSGNAATGRSVSLSRFEWVSTFYGSIEGLTPGGITFQDRAHWVVDLRGGAGDDTFIMKSTDFVAPVSIDGGGGVNTVDYSGDILPVPGQVSWYQAEGNALDAIGSNHGIPILVGYKPGREGRAFWFVGDDDYIRVPNAPSLEPTRISVEAWVKADTSNVFGGGYILAKGADADFVASYGLELFDGLRFFVSGAGGAYAASPDDSSIYDGDWHYVVGTYDGADVRLYVDGAEVGDGTPASFPIVYNLSRSNDLFIGAIDDSFHFAGLVDEVSIFNRALTAAEIEARFEGGSGVESSPGVYVNLRDGEATGLRGGVAKIQNVIGSDGNDILIGNGGNVLLGRGGRDLLAAGVTASEFYGGAGEDLLIGGIINDDSRKNLEAIMKEWAMTGPGNDYQLRLARLRADLLADDKLTGNGGGNTMTGGGGFDVFFGSLATDWQMDEGERVFPL
jgi:hypothetical protein